jgi:hypothetical protein
MKDEVGRDLCLRFNRLTIIINKYKNMSWADIDASVEEEEQAELAKEKLQKIKVLRQQLYASKAHELEEGEVDE